MDDKQEELHVTFAEFVCRVLYFSRMHPLQRFTLSCTSDEYLYLHIDILHSWIHAAISRNVEIMNICFNLGDPVDFPLSICTCETLVDLTLESGFLPFPASVWPPSLKVLKLIVVLYENDETTQELYSGCPVLERLRIDRHYFGDHRTSLNVMVPTVKSLNLVNYLDWMKDDFVLGEEPKHLIVNAPNLTYFCLEDNVSDDFTLLNLSSLLQASVSVYKACRTPGSFSRYLGNLYKLLGGIAHIRALTLSIFYDSTPPV